jgi:hypothetical protein
LVNEGHRLLTTATEDWYSRELETIKSAIIDAVIADGAPPLVNTDHPRLAA